MYIAVDSNYGKELFILSLHAMSEVRENVHNFAAGPSPLPTPVLKQAAEGLLNYNGTGMGVCELSHRGKDFKGIIEGAEGKTPSLLGARQRGSS